MAFRIGQKVVCLGLQSEAQHRLAGRAYPEKGGIYTIRGIETCGLDTALLLEEVVNEPEMWLLPFEQVAEACWHVSRFRPITERTTDISIFKEILDRENHGLPSRVDYPADCEPK